MKATRKLESEMREKAVE
jgi:hypothetical protein